MPILHFRSLVLIGGCLLLFGLVSGCTKDATGQPKLNDPKNRPVVPITVSAASEKTVPVQLRAIGKVQAYSTVYIKAQVEGELTTVHFKEGQEVKKGDLLFTIDPRPFEAQLKKTEALLAKEKAQLQNARTQVDRYSSVVKKGYVSQESYDQAVANACALEASVRGDDAAVESARLELKYCFIRSPIDGHTGEIKVHQGNLIKANDNEKPMLTINQVKPIYVAFAIPEKDLSEVKKYMGSKRLEVLASVPGDEGNPVKGHLDFMDNSVDPSTGTIQLKATFANEAKKLWPGQYVNVLLGLTTQSGAIVIPYQAVQTGQQGQYVFVVKPDFTVEYRRVVLGRTLDNEVVIAEGVAAGDTIVTDGQLRLANGSQVRIVENGDGKNSGAENNQ